MNNTITTNVQIWRQKAANGTITLAEMREAIAAIRKERMTADDRSTGKRQATATKAAKSAPVDMQSLMDEFNLL